MGDLVSVVSYFLTSFLPSVTRFKREEFEQKAKAMTQKHAKKEEEKENKRTIEDKRGGEKKLKI